MSQLTKTGIFAGAAVATIVLAVLASMPRRFGSTEDDATALLFPDFEAKAAQSMEIVKFDEDTGTRHEFKVALVTEDSGRKVWGITSHNNYPADANTQLAGAASALVDKQRGSQISSERMQHGTYGVLDPTQEAKAGERGMGTLVTFAGENDKKLAELIVGKEIPDQPLQPDQTRLHYVRLRGQDPVYRVGIDASKFSTKFEEWIERDLLKVERSRIKAITIRDLDIVADPQPRPAVRGHVELTHDDNASENRWSLADLKPGEKLDEPKLNDLRNAISDLKIVDVHKKPEALAALLGGKSERQPSPVDRLNVQASLEKHGFLILPEFGIVPSDGVVTVQMEDGLEYALFFGGVASLTADQSEAGRKQGDKKKGEGEKEGEKEDGAKLEGDTKDKAAVSNRYVFVNVQFNENLLKKPEIKPLPGEPLLPADEAAEKKSDAKETKAKPAGKSKKVALSDSIKELRRLTDEGLIDQAEWEHQRKQIERANQQAQEKYDGDVKAARKKEKELNERFADWYYVIDDQVYRKIRLKRTDVVKAPEKAKDEKAKDEKAKEEKAKAEPGKDAGAKAKAVPLKTP